MIRYMAHEISPNHPDTIGGILLPIYVVTFVLVLLAVVFVGRE